MKASYERASMSVIALAPNDIITTSPTFGEDNIIVLPDDIF